MYHSMRPENIIMIPYRPFILAPTLKLLTTNSKFCNQSLYYETNREKSCFRKFERHMSKKWKRIATYLPYILGQVAGNTNILFWPDQQMFAFMRYLKMSNKTSIYT